jgi:2-polyprenyl-3-methyl-5-hydroxy-6-metoxy-1,4-benzoquinol methylase
LIQSTLHRRMTPCTTSSKSVMLPTRKSRIHWEAARMSSQPLQEIKAGERFAFGSNWQRFLSVINEDRCQRAERSLQDMLEVDDLRGKRFLDIGSGSGLFSLAARRLGANVHSFDYDPQSVACTAVLKGRFFPDDANWTVQQGSALDSDFLSTLGKFDIVYSWGVLHHTGSMWRAIENTVPLVAPHGRLMIAIYNDQGGMSRRWRSIKRIYNTLPSLLRPVYAIAVMGPRELRFLALETLKGRPWGYFSNIAHYSERSTRGMSYWHDLIDWIGGYPFEVAKPEEIFQYYRQHGFVLRRLKTVAGSIGCNEFVFDAPG